MLVPYDSMTHAWPLINGKCVVITWSTDKYAPWHHDNTYFIYSLAHMCGFSLKLAKAIYIDAWALSKISETWEKLNEELKYIRTIWSMWFAFIQFPLALHCIQWTSWHPTELVRYLVWLTSNHQTEAFQFRQYSNTCSHFSNCNERLYAKLMMMIEISRMSSKCIRLRMTRQLSLA